MSDIVWVVNDSGACHLADAELAERQITGGPNAPEEFSNDAGLRVITDAAAAKLLGISDDDAAAVRGGATAPEAEPAPEEDGDETAPEAPEAAAEEPAQAEDAEGDTDADAAAPSET